MATRGIGNFPFLSSWLAGDRSGFNRALSKHSLFGIDSDASNAVWSDWVFELAVPTPSPALHVPKAARLAALFHF